MSGIDIQKGDIVTYRSGRVNNVNKPDKYLIFYNSDYKNRKFGCDFDIMKVQRYVKLLYFYRLKTIYERK